MDCGSETGAKVLYDELKNETEYKGIKVDGSVISYSKDFSDEGNTTKEDLCETLNDLIRLR